MSFFKRLLGDQNTKYLKTLQPLVEQINALEPDFEKLTALEFKAKTAEFKERFKVGITVDELLPEAFAAVREAAKRTLGQRHYDVQLLGGIALHQGRITEMRTGEGKTQVATLPTYLNALTGKGVHVVTVNDYLARRDTVWMGQIYDALGMSVGVINHESSYLYDPAHQEVDKERDTEGSFKIVYEFLKPCSRREAYAADITYGTNNEFGFDYLRDNLAHSEDRVAQLSSVHSRHHFAIVDEVDSILIDEARTPLIISAPIGESESLYQRFAQVAASLTQEQDYTVEEKTKTIALTEEGINKAEKSLGLENIYTEGGVKYVHHLESAVRAKALFERDRNYVVKDGEIIIVDEFTGRLQPGRRWSEGLHQAIEAKEGVKVQQESRTFASITFQNYFKLYEKLSGMTGTAMTSSEEFMRVYGLDTVAIPTHRPSARKDLDDLIFQSEAGKFKAVARQIKEINQKGQPVLVGTVSIEKNELLSAYLTREGVTHKILNAKNHEEEGAIIADAGKRGSVVVATNMAGRGVDIKLGGTKAGKEEHEEVKALGGLFVLGTERHEARRIDNQLRGRSGRQGDPGTTQFYISFDDDLARVFAPDKIKSMMGRMGLPEDEAINHRFISRAIENAQEKIEGLNFDMRKHLLDYDNVLNHQRQIIYGRRNAVLFGKGEAIDEFLARALENTSLGGEEQKTASDLIAQRRQEIGEEAFSALARQLILQVIDMFWVEHLEVMEYMRSSVKLRAYGQRDPLVEYKREGLTMFKEMERHIFDNVLQLLPNIGAQVKTESPAEMRAVHQSVVSIGSQNNNQQLSASNHEPKVGRNDPCPCGSGKKYKKCHGKQI
jgi:preprotein translocase subunit SecA